MSTGNTPRDDAELEAFLARKSALSRDYGNLELAEPPPALDEAILAVANAAAKPPVDPAATKPAVAKAATGQPPASAPAVVAITEPLPVASAARPASARAAVVDMDDDDNGARFRRPRWLIPAALAASVLVAVGFGVTEYLDSPSGADDSPFSSSLFAKRARQQREADKAAAATAAEEAAKQDAEVIELTGRAMPPPPVFEPEGPRVQDLDAAIALIRKELLLANQMVPAQEQPKAESPAVFGRESAAPVGKLADAAAEGASSVIQTRDRRLSKILELFDGGNTDLAADSLEIFLRDFEDDPVSQRILAVKP